MKSFSTKNWFLNLHFPSLVSWIAHVIWQLSLKTIFQTLTFYLQATCQPAARSQEKNLIREVIERIAEEVVRTCVYLFHNLASRCVWCVCECVLPISFTQNTWQWNHSGCRQNAQSGLLAVKKPAVGSFLCFLSFRRMPQRLLCWWTPTASPPLASII